ncbi:unnamed protein product, partial [Choristocarpus tenellus]
LNRRELLNSILATSAGVTTLGLAVPYLSFFMPPGGGKKMSRTFAKDGLGRTIQTKEFISTHFPGSRELVEGLDGDPTYLIVMEEGNIKDFSLNAICTHLGCVVPWVPAENKFICPCHNSHYNPEGAVLRGPAPRPLALSRVEEEDGRIVLREWDEEVDFRTGEAPWWKKGAS